MEHSSLDQAREDRQRPWAALDPDARLERSAALLEATHSFAPHAAVELYSRASLRVRVTMSGATSAVEEGFEAGLAARVVRDGAGIGFAACSGDGQASLRWVIERAIHGASSTGDRPWAEAADATLVDRAGSGVLPSAERMLEWLDRTSRAGEVHSAWLECALSVETLAAHRGPFTSRCRSRAWAFQQTRWGAPRWIAAPTLEMLDASAWNARGQGARLLATSPLQGRAIVFRSEAVSTLVLATVRSLQGYDDAASIRIGPGWRVADDPCDPRSTFGGWFDDAGFPARRKLLWNGREATGRIEGPGHLRRASYRDAPIAMATSLVVEKAGAAVEPAGATIVEELRIHPLEPRAWVLELAGTDASGRAFKGWKVAVDPWKMPERCVAASGEPSLLFDGFPG